MANKDRVTFGSKIGVILATVGCAVGLGSIWRFPYMVGSNGGGAFLLVFMICTVGTSYHDHRIFYRPPLTQKRCRSF